ncbi:MAG: deoxyribonuclease IV, partial [Methanomicrobiales archaeon]|nr:deoxyribonuclease IV [Methanomicrobiales archaeon]
ATVYKRSVEVMVREMGRCAALGIPHLITHLGSHLGEGVAAGRERLSDGIARALAAGPEGVVILLENTAGTKNSMGGTFPEIRDVMDAIDAPGRIGICLDTCHAYAAGYDLASPEAVAATLDAFETAIGFAHLFCVHCNDCKGPLGGALDRHEHIGLGSIGDAGFAALLSRPEIRRLPLICETPVDARRNDAENIRHIRWLAGPEPPQKKR